MPDTRTAPELALRLLSRAAVMSKIIVGVDLSPESERAVAHAVAVARLAGAEVVLVLADAVPELAEASTEGLRFIRENHQLLFQGHHDKLAALRERWLGHGVEISQLLVDGRAPDRLPAVATELGADLIVVGSHGRTGLKRLLIGSVAERVARYADRSVLVTRDDAPDGGYRRVAIGTDFSPQLEVAVQRALPLIARGARIEVVHCWQMPATDAGMLPRFADLEGAYGDALRAAVARVQALLGDRPDVELSSMLVPGTPARGLVDAAQGLSADLVVVGTHGRRGARRFILGSVAEVTLRHAHSSVLVAR